MELRPYQEEAVNAVWNHLRSRKDNPVVVLPQGCGKSVVIAELCRQAVRDWNGRVLILTHVRELISQNFEKVSQLLPSDSIGVHSAGLNKRDLAHPVIAAGIQSVYRKACDLGAFNLIIIDEVHTLPAGGEFTEPSSGTPGSSTRGSGWSA